MKIFLIIFFLNLPRGKQATDKQLDNSVTLDSRYNLSTDAIKFDEDPPDLPARFKNENKDDNGQSRSFFETASSSNQNYHRRTPENYIESTHVHDLNRHYNVGQNTQRNIEKNNYIKFEDKDKKPKIVFDNYQNTAESNRRDIENQEETDKSIEYTAIQDISYKRVVFENDAHASEELYMNKNNYKRPGTFSISDENPDKPNFQKLSHGVSTYIHPHLTDPYNNFPGYPPRQYAAGISEYSPISTNLAFPGGNHQLVQTGAKYPRQKYPGGIFQGSGLYSGQGGSRPVSNAGFNNAAVYQGPYRPSIQPMKLAQRAISAVTEALTSIALYDDKQCVPRLLCELSTGSTPRSPTLLKAAVSMGPLLTLLQSYNGIKSSPLFIFGRAAILGATSKGKPTTCRYAYPQCPNDPDKLINYLNNHNGGFFRFFGQPQKQQQNLEQFYNQLGQYGQLQQQQQQQQINDGQPYAFQNPYHHYNQISQDLNMDNEIAASDIEERIQNKPINNLDDDVTEETKWRFPDEVTYKQEENKFLRDNKRKAKKIKVSNEADINTLKFPDELEPANDIAETEDRDFVRKKKVIFFPDSNHFYFQANYESTTAVNLEEYVFDHKHNFFVKRLKYPGSDDRSETLYIVRDNPNNPEIVKVRPGQKL